MAKLSANGTEVHRLECAHVDDDGYPERITFSLRSNGKILTKVDFWIDGKHYGGKWKVHPVTIKRRLSPEKIERIADNLQTQGYVRV